MDFLAKKWFRISLATGIILLLTFQALVISSNVRYGSKYQITRDNMNTLISPLQVSLDLEQPVSQTIHDQDYYMLAYTGSDQLIDLITIKLDANMKQIANVNIAYNLNLSKYLQYKGLYFSDNYLWTMGVGRDPTTATSDLLRVLVKLDLYGDVIDRIILPPVKSQGETQLDTRSLELLYVNTSHAVWLYAPTYDKSTVVYFNLKLRTFGEKMLYMAYHTRISHFEGDKIWLYYSNDPYQEEQSFNSQSYEYGPPGEGQYAVSLEHPDQSFVESVLFSDTTSTTTQVLPSTITNSNITKPILAETDANFLIHDNLAIRPVGVYNVDDANNSFYGIESYSLHSKFFDIANVATLSTSLIAFLIAILIKYRQSSTTTKIAPKNVIN